MLTKDKPKEATMTIAEKLAKSKEVSYELMVEAHFESDPDANETRWHFRCKDDSIVAMTMGLGCSLDMASYTSYDWEDVTDKDNPFRNYPSEKEMEEMAEDAMRNDPAMGDY